MRFIVRQLASAALTALVVSLETHASSAAQPPTFAAPYQAYRIAAGLVSIADLNRDGRGEILTDHEAYVLGETSAGFYADLSVAYDVLPMAIDLNSDGRLDVAIVERDKLRILLATPNGTLQPASWRPIPLYSTLTSGDFDEDGRMDVVVVNYSETTVLFGAESGTFRESRVVPFGTGIAAASGDFDGDGHLDLAVAHGGWSDSYLGLDFGDGTGGFTPRMEVQVPGGSRGIRTGDFNGDGSTDILFQGEYAPSLLLNRGDGSFGAPQGLRQGRVSRCADFNGDGADDIVVGAPGLTIYVNGSERHVLTPGPVRGLDTGDVNGDGRMDVALCADGGWVFTSLGNGDGTLGSLDYHLTGVGGSFSAFADFDGNGFVDVFAGAYRDVWVALGSIGTFGRTWSATLPPEDNLSRGRCGDFNGDGRADLAVVAQRQCGYHCYRHFLHLWRSTGFGFESLGQLELSSHWFEIADVTGDGRADLICSQVDPVSRYSMLTVIPGSSDGFGSPIRSPVTYGSEFLAVGDVNGDALPDLAFVEGFCLGIGEGQFASLTAYPGGDRFDYAVLEDLDGDGRDELIGSRSLHVELLEGLGSGAAPVRTVLSRAVAGPISVADVNDDGFLDIASGQPVTSLHIGRPAGSPSFDRDYGGFATDGRGPIALTDVDGDGLKDLLAPSAWGRNLGAVADWTPPVVRMESPNEGGSFPMGSPMTIRWSASDSAGVTGVELVLAAQRDTGVIKAHIASGLPATGSLEWTPQPAHAGPGWIRAVARDPSGNIGVDAADQPINVVPPSVTLTVDSLKAVAMLRGIRVIWSLSPQSQITSVTLFRTEGDPAGPPSVIADDRLAQDHFDDRLVAPGIRYTYMVEAHTLGAVQDMGAVSITFPDTNVTLPDSNATRNSLDLRAGPTPFSSSTAVRFELPGSSPVRLSVLDVRGREVGVLVDDVRNAGIHYESVQASFMGSAPGVYFIHLRTQFGTRSRRIVLLP